MKVLIFENNLFWVARLKHNLKSLHLEYEVFTTLPTEVPEGNVAIVNLSNESTSLKGLVRNLKLAGMYVIGHAGHKEKSLLKQGEIAGCDKIVSNSMLTHKLGEILAQIPSL